MKVSTPRKKILVVEDKAGTIEILTARYKVRAASDGTNALESARLKDLPNQILLDIIMPDMDGYEICRQLNTDEVANNIPAIFLKVKDEVQDELNGFDLRAVDYSTKPNNPPRFLARIEIQLALMDTRKELEKQNEFLKENICLRQDVYCITRHDLRNPPTEFLISPLSYQWQVI